MVRKNLSDTLANLVGYAVGDIRDRLVEEAWFGRPINSKTELAFYEDLHLQERPSEDPLGRCKGIDQDIEF